MAWLEKLDARTLAWPAPARWAYLGLKWVLIIAGALSLIGLSLERFGLWTPH